MNEKNIQMHHLLVWGPTWFKMLTCDFDSNLLFQLSQILMTRNDPLLVQMEFR